MVSRTLNDYGMIVVLLALCVLFSALTLKQQTPSGDAAILELTNAVKSGFDREASIVVAGAAKQDSAGIAQGVAEQLAAEGFTKVRLVVGAPRDLRLAVEELTAQGARPSVIATSGNVLTWRVFRPPSCGQIF